MGMSLQERISNLPADERRAWLAQQPDWMIEEMQRGEWWWVARPEQIPPNGSWFLCLALAGRGFGKQISIFEYIPVPRRTIGGEPGFVQLKDLLPGDWVFDEEGKSCRVTQIFDIEVPEKAYRIHFSDGTFIDACSEHEWVTWEHRDRKAYLRSQYEGDATQFPADWPNWRPMKRYKSNAPYRDESGPGPRIRTSQNIRDTLTHGVRGDLNHCIPLAGALDLPELELPLDPWVLGFWIGNGSTGTSSISMNGDDEDYVRLQCRAAGFACGNEMNSYHDKNVSTFTVYELITHLKAIGAEHKEIPNEYLWGSIDQRKALLAGLLDSDGHMGKSNGIIEFCSMRRDHADAVLHLARSLGQVPRLCEGMATLNGVDYGTKYRVYWRPTFNPFRSPRKSDNYIPPAAQGLRTRHRMITKVDSIKPVPMRCISVDSPNSMYLVGKAMIPTHNSRAGSEWIVGKALQHPYDNHGVPTEWLVAAETLADARTICMEGPAGILRVLERRKIKHRYKMSPRPMIIFPSGSKIYTEGADNPDIGRGLNLSGSWLDEVAKWRFPKRSWEEGIMPALRSDLAGSHPQAFVTTTPKPVDILQEWVKRTDGTVHVIRGSTFDNASNLSALVVQELKRRYDGTMIGRQELYGEIIEAFDGALFSRLDIENSRLDSVPVDTISTVVGVDPSLTGEDDEMGIVVVSRDRENHLYVLADRSIMSVGRAAALETWRVVAEWGADELVCEVTIGKRWMQQVFHDAYYELVGQGLFPENTKPPIRGIDSKIGKRVRGEPVAMRCEQGRLHMVGHFPELEDQMAMFTGWGNRESPDRLDALVHACRFLMEGEKKQVRIASPRDVLSTTLQSLWDGSGSYNVDF
jgi:phage terminase large subunit-like protein